MSNKDETGGGVWVLLKGENSMVVSVIGCKKALVCTGRATSVLLKTISVGYARANFKLQ